MINNNSFWSKLTTFFFQNPVTDLIFPLHRYLKAQDHQAISALAPRTGIVIGTMFLLHHLFWSPFSFQGLFAALLGGAALFLGAV
jgi:hypothetical protein